MEKLTVKFSLSPKEMFFINIYSSIKTTLIVFMLGAVLSVVSAMLFGFNQAVTIVNWKNYYEGIFILSMMVIGAGLVYQLGIMIFAGIRVLIYSKKDSYMLDERIISIDEEKGIILYSDDRKEGVKWGHYKFYFENQKYLVLRDDVNKMFILKKEALSPEELQWFKQNHKTQIMIEYRKKLEAKRRR